MASWLRKRTAVPFGTEFTIIIGPFGWAGDFVIRLVAMSAEDEWSGNCASLWKDAPLSVAAPLGCASNAGGSAEVDDSATFRPKTKRGKRANKQGQEAPEAP